MATTTQQQQMIQAFAQWGAKKFGKGQMTPEQFMEQFQALDQDKQQQLVQAFQQEMQQGGGAQMARLGAKLNYIKSLKGGCPEGQELVYFKKGGRFCKECMDKKAKGGKTNDPVADFKKARKEKCGGKAK